MWHCARTRATVWHSVAPVWHCELQEEEEVQSVSVAILLRVPSVARAYAAGLPANHTVEVWKSIDIVKELLEGWVVYKQRPSFL